MPPYLSYDLREDRGPLDKTKEYCSDILCPCAASDVTKGRVEGWLRDNRYPCATEPPILIEKVSSKKPHKSTDYHDPTLLSFLVATYTYFGTGACESPRSGWVLGIGISDVPERVAGHTWMS